MIYWTCPSCKFEIDIEKYWEWKHLYRNSYVQSSSRCLQCKNLDDQMGHLKAMATIIQKQHLWMFLNPKKDRARRWVHTYSRLKHISDANNYIPL